MDPCQAWTDLFDSKDRGRIYHHFVRERTALTDHLKTCHKCATMVMFVDIELSQAPDNLHFLNDMQFAELIRELHKKRLELLQMFAPS